MSYDSETVEDTKEDSLAEVTDDSCTVKFIEIVPLDRASDDHCVQDSICCVVEVKPEDLLDVKQEPADESDNEDSNYSVKKESDDEYQTEFPCFTTPVQVRTTVHIKPISDEGTLFTRFYSTIISQLQQDYFSQMYQVFLHFSVVH